MASDVGVWGHVGQKAWRLNGGKASSATSAPGPAGEQGLQQAVEPRPSSGRYQGLWSQNPDGPLAKISAKSMVPLKFYT